MRLKFNKGGLPKLIALALIALVTIIVLAINDVFSHPPSHQ